MKVTDVIYDETPERRKGENVLAKDFRFIVVVDTFYHHHFRVPAGSPWDGQSGPKWAHGILPRWHYAYDPASLIHDSFYKGTVHFPSRLPGHRLLADQAFLVAMKPCPGDQPWYTRWYKKAIHWCRCWAMYFGVRAGGAGYWEGEL